ncbi:hypothetical protein GDO86_000551 [Hymenochirus boettgeri]|uniref:Mineralocorticoid receptor n=1 Tax=Hymenochirus boettgeri TaxID=247094 RepID=A0A8T2KDL0_9PIPI|nr:hypothetical protein GDO86_000551 [Hymenochirus boettgeri]
MERQWGQAPQSMDYSSPNSNRQTSENMYMETVNVACDSDSDSFTPNTLKLESKEKQDLIHCIQEKNSQPGILTQDPKPDLESKELSATVAESMGLYMDSVRDSDYAYDQHNQQGTLGLGNIYQGSNQLIKFYKQNTQGTFPLDHQGQTVQSVIDSDNSINGKLKSNTVMSPLSYHEKSSAASSPSNMALSVCSPTGINSVSSTSCPTSFGNFTVHSPINQGTPLSCSPNVENRCPISHSPAQSGTIESPLSSPLSSMKSPISSPPSHCSLKSPVSSPNNITMRPSVSSPGNLTTRSSLSSPSNANNRSTLSSPAASSMASSICSPAASVLGFPSTVMTGEGAAADTVIPAETKDKGSQQIMFPKVETMDNDNNETSTVSLVKFIKPDPDGTFRNTCFGNNANCSSDTGFPVSVKQEPCKNTCSSSLFKSSQSANPFPFTDGSYFSFMDDKDYYSLSGILGPPVSSFSEGFEGNGFSNQGLTMGIKQEPANGTFYSENNTPSSAIVGVNSCGQSFHYRIGAQGTISVSRPVNRDQSFPNLSSFPPVSSMIESWKTQSELTQNSLSSRRNDGFPVQGYIPENVTRCVIMNGISIGPVRTKGACELHIVAWW